MFSKNLDHSTWMSEMSNPIHQPYIVTHLLPPFCFCTFSSKVEHFRRELNKKVLLLDLVFIKLNDQRKKWEKSTWTNFYWTIIIWMTWWCFFFSGKHREYFLRFLIVKVLMFISETRYREHILLANKLVWFSFLFIIS
jgi:hypothetical protein